MAESPKTKSSHEIKFTEEQENALSDIRTHLNFLQVLRPTLDNLIETNDISGIRKLFESKKITSKRGFALVNRFASAFNFTISVVPPSKKKTAGKQKKHQLCIIIQRLMEAEKNQSSLNS